MNRNHLQELEMNIVSFSKDQLLLCSECLIDSMF